LGAGVEVYGGALLNSWLDRDLGVSGRVFTRPRGSSDQLATLLVRSDEPLMRVPQLAIHLDRAVREGLVLNPQEHLQPIWGYGQAGATLDLIAQALNTRGEVIEESPGSPGTPVTKPLDTGDIEGFDLMLHPAEAPRRIGAPDHTGQPQLLASARLDNLMSCWAAGAAMIETEVERSAPPDGREGPGAPTAVMAIFDAEEVGSETMTGAGGRLLEQVLTALCGGDALLLGNTLARSVALSMDMSHAVHPNYPDRHDPAHVVQPGAGPAIKVNASQRYSTSGAGIAYLRTLAADAGIPVQVYSHRGDLPCGSTIGPILATRLSVPTIDIGAPQLSMHSARELMACTDVAPTAQLAAAFLRRRVGPPCS
jgi:aspartyl aminopeptidase